jgi:hypothetical protein
MVNEMDIEEHLKKLEERVDVLEKKNKLLSEELSEHYRKGHKTWRA